MPSAQLTSADSPPRQTHWPETQLNRVWQSESSQQSVLKMHSSLHSLWVVLGQTHVFDRHTFPPRHSLSVQQALSEIHTLSHSFDPEQEQEDVVLHVPPGPQSESAQQTTLSVHTPLHRPCPGGHLQVPPSQKMPPPPQSESVQHNTALMHPSPQGFTSPTHTHCPSTQDLPPGQSTLTQQAAISMHLSRHSLRPSPHSHPS